MNRIIALLALWLLLIPAGAAPAADPAAFVAVGTGDEQPVGTLTNWNADGSAELATANGAATVRDAISLRRVAVPLPAFPRGAGLLTTTGDRIPGRLLGGDDQSLQFQSALAEKKWDVPLSAVAVLWLGKPPADTPTDPARYPWIPDNRNRDILLFRNGDTATGTVTGFAADKAAILFKPDTGDTRAVPFGEVAAVAFNPTLAKSRKPKGPYAQLVLRDGTRLAATTTSADAESLKAKSLFGQAVEVPIADLVALDAIQGKAKYLAEMKPKKVELSGFLGANWPWRADRTVRGAPLRLHTPAGESTFDRGLGTHPRTALTFDLGGKYRRFEALVGLDAGSGQRGRAAVRVRVDGKEQPLPDLLKLRSGNAIPLRVDVTGAKELMLSVDFGPEGDVQADVNWADARLVE